jgi:hypothetical protein
MMAFTTETTVTIRNRILSNSASSLDGVVPSLPALSEAESSPYRM